LTTKTLKTDGHTPNFSYWPSERTKGYEGNQ